MAVLRGERVLLRPGRPEDANALVQIRKEPEVARRWGFNDIEEEVHEGFVGNDQGFVIEVDGEPVGAIQYAEEDDPMYRHASMDIFLATSRHGRGLGAEGSGSSLATSSRGAATTASRSTRRRTTPRRSGPTRRWAFAQSGSCASTSAVPTASGATGC